MENVSYCSKLAKCVVEAKQAGELLYIHESRGFIHAHVYVMSN
jgi:hypothetical protein